MVRFAHFSDCHIGAWRDPRLRELMNEALTKAVTEVIERKCDFLLLAGDLFNTAVPGVDYVKHVFQELRRLKKRGIRVYFIAGSHDYSPTGKSMLTILEEAELGVNVFQGTVTEEVLSLRFVVDEPTGIKITGIIGRAQQLDQHYYKQLDVNSLEQAEGKKIFLFHTSISELLPKGLSIPDATSVSSFPKGFTYYAGGHIHSRTTYENNEYSLVAYPGPLFPASFSELETLREGGMIIAEIKGETTTIERIPITLRKVFFIKKDVTGLEPETVFEELKKELNIDVQGKIVLVRLHGELLRGTPSQIDFTTLFSDCEARGAYTCQKNSYSVTSPELIETPYNKKGSDVIEEEVITEHLGQIPICLEEKQLFKELFRVLSQEKSEEENTSSYEERILSDSKNLFFR